MPYDPARHGPRRATGPGFHARVHALVRRVPPGFVTTYGAIARALGSPNVARHVGFALAALPPGSDVPWWRVVAAGGRLAVGSATTSRLQAKRLAQEGLAVRRGRVAAFAAHAFPFAD